MRTVPGDVEEEGIKLGEVVGAAATETGQETAENGRRRGA